MKAQHASLWFLGAVFFLCSVHTRGLRRCLISMDMHHIEESFREIKGAIQAKDIFQNVTILSTSEILSSVKPLGVCCMTKNLLAFYMDRVFKDHQELNPQILRKISSIANSFLYMQKALQQCCREVLESAGQGGKVLLIGAAFTLSQQEQRLCHCGQEATNATRIIHDNYNQLEVQSAALKSLGELDIFLAWIHKNHQGTSTA